MFCCRFCMPQLNLADEVRLLISVMVSFIAFLVGCAPPPTEQFQDYFYDYSYLPVAQPFAPFVVTSGNTTTGISIIHGKMQGSEVSRPDSTDYHFFRASDSGWIHFAIPVSFTPDMERWEFQGCQYKRIFKRSGFPGYEFDPKVHEAFFVIQGVCRHSSYATRYLYTRSKGVLAFAAGNLNAIGTDEEFDQGYSLVLIGDVGFGRTLH